MSVHESRRMPWFGFGQQKKDRENEKSTPPPKQTHHKTGPYVSLDFPNK